MRKVCLLMLIIMTLLLTSCSSGDSNMVRDLFIKKSDISEIEIIPNEDLINYLKENNISEIY